MTLPLIVLLLVTGWIVLVSVSAQRECRWCHGTGRWLLGWRCWRCGGDGHTWRLGARLVHRARLTAVKTWRERERRDER